MQEGTLPLSSDVLREECVEGNSAERLMGPERALVRTRNRKSKAGEHEPAHTQRQCACAGEATATKGYLGSGADDVRHQVADLVGLDIPQVNEIHFFKILHFF